MGSIMFHCHAHLPKKVPSNRMMKVMKAVRNSIECAAISMLLLYTAYAAAESLRCKKKGCIEEAKNRQEYKISFQT